MLLTGGVLHRFVYPSPRLDSIALVRRRGSHALTCSSRTSSPRCPETSPLSYHRRNPMEVHCQKVSQNLEQSIVSTDQVPGHPSLAFDRLQVSDERLCEEHKRSFGRFVARVAMVDEEYWAAAWLRTEAQFEYVSYMRHVNMYKRKYSEQEFYSLKRRCAGRYGDSLECNCIVSVKKEDPNIRRTVLNSIVGTLDLSIRQLIPGASLPGEIKKDSDILVGHEASLSQRYAYISNVCVSKSSRRKGIATNMLQFAADSVLTSGMTKLYIHVNADNQAALNLYKRTGFVFVEEPSCILSKGQRLLMCWEI